MVIYLHLCRYACTHTHMHFLEDRVRKELNKDDHQVYSVVRVIRQLRIIK